MKRPRRSRLDEPTAGWRGGGERNRAEHEELIRRTAEERDDTPRRYDQPTEADPVMPSDETERAQKR